MMGYFYGDIVGLEGASGLRSDQPHRRYVSKGDELNQPQPLLRQQGRMVSAPQTSLPHLWQVRVLKLAPAILCPARVPCCARQHLSQAAAASLSKSSLCARFEHSRARNKQF